MPKKAPETVLYGAEFQRRSVSTDAKPFGPVRAIISSQRPPEQKLYGRPFQAREA